VPCSCLMLSCALPCCAVLWLQVRRNAHVEIVPLSTGCLGSCTYCKTKHARGQLGSYRPEAIVARVAAAGADPLVRGGGERGTKGAAGAWRWCFWSEVCMGQNQAFSSVSSLFSRVMASLHLSAPSM
jgi:hypothetical protein